MYINKCTKCGKEFETKNPKRVICPDCLYPDRTTTSSAPSISPDEQQAIQQNFPRSYSAGVENENYKRPRPQGAPQQRKSNNRIPGRFNNQGGGKKPFNRNGKKPFNKGHKQKTLLINKEQLAQIEELYKKMLPLPNPDAHEVIGEKIGLEPKKVFFGINLIRQKMMLPKINFPKRKLALSSDQLLAIKNLYEPLMPLPPIGCHKIIAAQLRMDEWRVHVGIGLVRKQMGLERWNQEREDAPPEFKKKAE